MSVTQLKKPVKPKREDAPPVSELTIRDYYAASALRGGFHEFMTAGETWRDHDDFAETCFNVADAMLRARLR